MNVSLYQAAAALNANSRWQDVISGNLAASAVPGFKKQDLSFDALQAGLTNPLSRMAGTDSLMPKASASTNFQQGTLRPTGDSTDLALEGTGFFEVQMPDGSRAYTRDGEFQIGPQGQLVTKQGYQVLGEGGPIQFDPNNPGPITIAPTGEISQGSDLKGRIKLGQFPDAQQLVSIGSGLFQPQDPSEQPQDCKATVRQGFLENANTSPILEMANLVSAMRTFEANQRVMQLHDERMSKAISELGSPN